MDKEIRDQQQAHVKKTNKVTVQIASFNTGGNAPQDYQSIVQIFQETGQQDMPDIVIVGLQEMIKSTVRAMLKNFFKNNAEELA